MAGNARAAIVFFDTSAIARRYQQSEQGSRRVRALCRASAGHRLILTRMTVTEIASMLGRKAREGSMTVAQRQRVWHLFHRHQREQYHLLSLDEQVYRLTERLLFAHPLRAYDAVHVASALLASRLMGPLVPFRFCTADQVQARAAQAEGLDVELIS